MSASEESLSRVLQNLEGLSPIEAAYKAASAAVRAMERLHAVPPRPSRDAIESECTRFVLLFKTLAWCYGGPGVDAVHDAVPEAVDFAGESGLSYFDLVFSLVSTRFHWMWAYTAPDAFLKWRNAGGPLVLDGLEIDMTAAVKVWPKLASELEKLPPVDVGSLLARLEKERRWATKGLSNDGSGNNLEALTDQEAAVDECIRQLGNARLKDITKHTGIGVNVLTTHTIPALKKKRGLKSNPYRYTT